MEIRQDASLPELVASFIELGRSGSELCPDQCGDAEQVRRLLLCGIRPWQVVGRGLTDDEIRDLIRGLVLYSRAVGHGIGGSVSPVIVLYSELIGRLPDWEPEFTSWVVANRRNRWEPFGTLNDGNATTFRAFKSYCETCATEQAKRYEAGLKRQAADQEAKRARDRRESTERIAAAVQRGDRHAVEALLKKGPDLSAALPDGGSLVDLALAHERLEIAALLRKHTTP